MSKSIKDYREAMDNIKISDSFYKRTENLLTEMSEASETRLEKRRTFSAGRIAALMSAAAACIIAAVGFRAAISGRTETGELTEATVLTEVCGTAEVTDTASPLIDDIAIREDSDLDGGVPVSQSEQGAAKAADGGDTVGSETDGTGTAEAGTAEAGTAEAVAETTAPAVTTTAAPVSKPAVTAATASAAPVKPKDSGVTGAGDHAAPTEATDKETDKTTAPHTEQTAPAETVPLLSDVNFDAAMVEITPYFDMGNIKSGENAVKKTGAECKDIIGFISGITETSHEIGNYSFTSLFSLQITDSGTGTTLYNIYVTDLNAVVITKHDDAGQTRFTYGVNASDYEALKHVLFLQFGAEDDYELFSSLISGK